MLSVDFVFSELQLSTAVKCPAVLISLHDDCLVIVVFLHTVHLTDE